MRGLFLLTFALVLVAIVAGCGATPGPGSASYLVYVRDRQGSVIAAVDDRGTKVWETHDDAYGLRLSSSGAEIPREFLDQPFDEETGFYHFRYRTYDPATAQWLSPDPKLISDQDYCTRNPELCNPYAYGGDRPGEWPDFDGREAHQEITESGRILHVTIGVYGAYAAAVAADLQNIQSQVLGCSGVTLDAKITVHQTRDQLSPDETPVDANLASETSHYQPPSSTIVVGSDTTRSTLAAEEILLHELLHVFSAREGYSDSTGPDGARHSSSLPGEARSFMGAMRGSGPFGLTSWDESGMDHPADGLEANQGEDLRASTMPGDVCAPSQR